MEPDRKCSQCGASLPADAPDGLCPQCLLKAGLGGAGAGGPTLDVSKGHLQTDASTPARSTGFTPPDPKDLANLFPQLEIIELLGRGGMGAVYKACQPALDRLVAVKILPPEAGGAEFAERFTREARALAKLSHPNIVAIHDFGRAGDLYYLVMEFVDGMNLRQVQKAGQCSPKEALAIIPQICDALQFAHDEGIVHRDIKPENVLLDKKGRVKIADFGLAKLLTPAPGDHTLTGSGHVMGTLHYMAPEQMERPLEVDHRADVYSLGVVFYEMLTGELPLGRFLPPSQKVQMDARLDEVVLHALERDVERRYQHVSEVKTDVEHVTRTPVTASASTLLGSQPARQPSSATGPQSGAISRVRAPAETLLLVAAIALFTALAVGGWLWAWGRFDPNATQYSRSGERQWTLVGMAVTLAGYAIFVGAAGLLMRGLRARLFCMLVVALAGIFIPSCLAYNVVDQFKDFPAWQVLIPLWLGVPACVWAVLVLFREDVRAAFARDNAATGRKLVVAVTIFLLLCICFFASRSWQPSSRPLLSKDNSLPNPEVTTPAQIEQPQPAKKRRIADGAKVSISFANKETGSMKAAEIVDSIAKQAGANVVYGEEVIGFLDLRLNAVPYQDALAAVAQALGLVIVEYDNITLITSREKEQQYAATSAERRRFEERVYEGNTNRASMLFKNADITNVCTLLATQADANIVIGHGIRGAVSLRVENASCGEVLNAIVRYLGFVAVPTGEKTVAIVSPDKLAQYKEPAGKQP